MTFSSNADSLFLSWELTDDRIQFDSYRITDNKSQQVLTVGRDETSCLLTHVPYNEPVAIYLSLVAGGEVVKTAKTDVVIDGLDKTTAATLIPDRGSVTGGDGTYSIPLPDGRSIFLMGDSYIGPVTNGQRPTSDHMFRNTYILYDEGRVSVIYGAGGDGNASAAVPPGVSDESRKWYWPGHGFVEGNTLYVFQTVMYQGAEGMWGFRYETTDILEYELPSLTLRRTTRIPFRGSEDIHYGMAALNDGDYVYVYAQVDVTNDADPISEVLVARTTPAKLCTDWEYYTGSGWSTDPSAAERLEGLASVPVSSQFNVFRLRDKYVLLTQNKRYNSGEIYTFTSDSPAGPWRNKQLIYRIPAMENRKFVHLQRHGAPPVRKGRHDPRQLQRQYRRVLTTVQRRQHLPAPFLLDRNRPDIEQQAITTKNRNHEKIRIDTHVRGGLRGAHGLRGCLGPHVVRLPEHLRHKIRHPPGPPVRPCEHQRNRRGGEVRLLRHAALHDPRQGQPDGQPRVFERRRALLALRLRDSLGRGRMLPGHRGAAQRARIKGTDNVVAYFQNGEFSVPFQLDCEELNYKYTFKEIVE